MGNGYVLSPRAIADLAHIWDSTQTKWGEAQADRYTDALDTDIEPQLDRKVL